MKALMGTYAITRELREVGLAVVLLFEIATVMMSACAAPPSHQYFEERNNRKIGNKLQNVTVPQQIAFLRRLPNGNEEYRYHFFKTCYVAYEVDASRTVVRWRYDGDTRDCYINP